MTGPNYIVIQGAGEGAYEEDRHFAAMVQEQVGNARRVAYPKINGLETLDWSTAKTELEAALNEAGDGCVVVAHSLGGASILKLLSEGANVPRIEAFYLVATPYKGKDGEFGADAFAMEPDFGDRLPQFGLLKFYHSQDDEFVPVAHIERCAEKLPTADVEIVDGQGHQFAAKPFTELARDMKAISTAA
jgi:predicted alpha/beta hydrolase family esterase